MFDIHSHILFGVDDGPKTIEESISLIKKMQNEGITKILATPHFYPQDTDLADYLKIINNNFKTLKNDEYLDSKGRVMDAYLSEHLCQGMLEGYLLTGRHGFIHSYEAFVRIVDSMASQHAKWLKVCNQIPWRAPIASLNYMLVSHVFQQDHNGYTHQDPGFLNHLVTKKADVVRMYLPPDTNCL